MYIPRRGFFKKVLGLSAHRITEFIVDAGHNPNFLNDRILSPSPEEAGLALANKNMKRSRSLMVGKKSVK